MIMKIPYSLQQAYKYFGDFGIPYLIVDTVDHYYSTLLTFLVLKHFLFMSQYDSYIRNIIISLGNKSSMPLVSTQLVL